jgi:hypothetical protein
VSFLAPAAFGLLSLAIPLIVLYMLRSRRQRVEVPSIYLWQQMEQFVSAAIPWQRLRITAALLLQLLALAVFALLLARPFIREETLLGPHSVLIIDTSGSMAMEGRLDAARDQALSLIDDVSEEKLVSIVEAGPDPTVRAAFGRDEDLLAAAIQDLEPTGGGEDLAGALRLARGLATPDRPTTLVFLSDGGFEGALPEPINDARHLRFDASGANLAITAFGTSAGDSGTTRVFVEVSNFDATDRAATVELLVDDLPVGTVDLAIPAGGERRELLAVDAGPGQTVVARLAGNEDSLPLDDEAALVLTAGVDLAVTVVGTGSFFLDALLGSLEGVGPAEGVPPDLLIVDRGSAAVVDRPAWIIAPTEPPAGLTVTGRLDNPVVTFQRPGEPMLDGIDLADLAIAEAQILDAPGWIPILTAGDVPLILIGDVAGQRAVYFAFDLTRSNLPVQVTFPVLGARIIEYLAGNPVGAGAAAPAGTPIPLAAPPGFTAVAELPDGTTRELATGTLYFTGTGRPGIYRISYENADTGETRAGPVAVRRFAPQESAGPARDIGVVAPDTGSGDEATLLREWAPWILGALLVVVVIEWWVALGRPVPRRRKEAPA